MEESDEQSAWGVRKKEIQGREDESDWGCGPPCVPASREGASLRNFPADPHEVDVTAASKALPGLLLQGGLLLRF